MSEQRAIVTTTDAETGEELGRMEMGPESDYVIVTGPNFHIAHEQRFANGTTQLTIKRFPAEATHGE